MGSVHGRSVNSFGALARVTRVFDTDRSRALAVADELGAEAAEAVEEAVGATDVDAVVISIPPRFHRSVVEPAIAHGKSVFLEKPIAIDRADATAIVDAAQYAHGTLMVGHALRFWPGYPEVHALVTGGSLGAPISVVCTRLQAPPATTGWLADVGSTGGIAPLVLVHDFDLMNWLLGTPLSVSSFVLQGAGAGATHVVVGVTYERGRGVAEGSIALPKSHPFATSIDVHCERGSVHFGYEIARNAQATARDASQFTPSAPPVVIVHPDDGGPPRTIEISGETPWRLEMEYFLRQVASDGAIEIGSPQQAVAALDVALAARASFESGRTEEIESGATR
jgi:predicted dehydrogenase